MVDMKVLVYNNFSKNFLKKNEISKLHEEWKISPSEVLGQGSKNEGVVHPFFQNARPISKLTYNIQKRSKK
jgi:hypothetical protein